MNFSVLISIYHKEKACNLRDCLQSVFSQTVPPQEVVLVKDGSLNNELDSEIQRQKDAHPELTVVALAENRGLGIALNEGMKHCHHDIVARMDADDICLLDRYEKQLAFLEAHPETDVVGAWISEFIESPENIVSIRNLPEHHQDIYRFGKSRNPINHPVVMFRKKAVMAVGGYQHMPLFEDYYLWARMLKKGYRFHNLQEPLLLFRRSSEMILRRGGIEYARHEMVFQKAIYRLGYISSARMIANVAMRFGIRIVPNWLRSLIYSHFLRRLIRE